MCCRNSYWSSMQQYKRSRPNKYRKQHCWSNSWWRNRQRQGCRGGTNTANQGISQATMQHKMQHVLQELLLVQHATIQAFKANKHRKQHCWSNSWWRNRRKRQQVLPKVKPIMQAKQYQGTMHKMQHVSQELLLVQHATTRVLKATQTPEVTLLVKQLAAEQAAKNKPI